LTTKVYLFAHERIEAASVSQRMPASGLALQRFRCNRGAQVRECLKSVVKPQKLESFFPRQTGKSTSAAS
jgi:hypothetical protein